MKCPFCGYEESKVIDSRPTDENEKIRRRRECISCGKRFTTYEKVETIIEILERFLDRDYYNEEGQSIWSYEEYLVHNIECLINLKVLRDYLKEHPDTECYFYDSY